MAADRDERLLTVAEVADRLRVHPITVRRHIKAGRLGAVRIGRNVRVRSEDLEAFLQPRAAEARALYRAPSPSELARRRKVAEEILARRPARRPMDMAAAQEVRVRQPSGSLHYPWPPTPKEMARRRKIVEAMRAERAKLPKLGQSTVDLVREGRRDQDEPYRIPPWLGG